jgi:two-component system alkaline phosphatase synthesis response regulator PhoP
MTEKRVLVVDDDKPYCKLVASGFVEQGFEVYTANDGANGLKLFNEKKPPIVLLDVAMPGMSGFEVAATIRKEESPERHTIIVIMTAHARSFFVSQEFELKIDSYLTKPMLPSEILSTVTALMG